MTYHLLKLNGQILKFNNPTLCLKAISNMNYTVKVIHSSLLQFEEKKEKTPSLKDYLC